MLGIILGVLLVELPIAIYSHWELLNESFLYIGIAMVLCILLMGFAIGEGLFFPSSKDSFTPSITPPANWTILATASIHFTIVKWSALSSLEQAVLIIMAICFTLVAIHAAIEELES